MRYRQLVNGIVLAVCLLSLSGCMETVVVTQGIGSNLSFGTQVNDYTLRGRALIALYEMDLPKQSSVDVSAFNGMLLVLGQVPSRYWVNEITDKLRVTPGARVIYNRLTVAPGGGFIDSAEDSAISANVKTDLLKTVNPLHFKVVTEDGVVYLMGYTTKQEAKLALATAKNAAGVKKVVPIFDYIKPQRAKIYYGNSN